MKKIAGRFSVLIFCWFVLPAFLHAQPGVTQAQNLIVELGEYIQQARAVEAELNSSIATKLEYDQEKAVLDREKRDYDSRVRSYNNDLRRFNTEIDRYNRDCDRQLSLSEFEECEEWAESLDPQKRLLDERLGELNEEQAALNSAIAEWNARDSVRAEADEEMLSRYDAIETSIQDLIDQLLAMPVFQERANSCRRSASPEATQQCLLRFLNSSGN